METEQLDRHSEEVTHFDRIFAVPMFVVTVLFLVLLAGLLHLTDGDLLGPLGTKFLAGLGVLYLCFVVETIVHWRCVKARMVFEPIDESAYRRRARSTMLGIWVRGS